MITIYYLICSFKFDFVLRILLRLNESFWYKIFHLAGWGARQEGSPYKSNVLQVTQVPVVSNEQCEKTYQSLSEFEESPKFDIFDAKHVLCAGYAAGGKDACDGDYDLN